METAAIGYRVADFLSKHPPFNAVEEGDLLALARLGRVRFCEANEYIAWQGDPYRMQVLVIQQGTVSLWDEAGEVAELRDVRGTGDMLGIEQFNDGDAYPYSARSASDVVIYSFPAIEFEALILKYPYAQQYVAAYGKVTADYQSTAERRDPQNIFLHDVAGQRKLASCSAQASIRDVARSMLTTDADAIAVLDSEQRPLGVLTASSFLEWIGDGGEDPRKPVTTLLRGAPLAIASNATVTDGVLAMGAADAAAIAITSDGTSEGRLHAIVTSRDLGTVFGDHPVGILREISHAADTQALRGLNQRARALTLQYLNGAASFDWLARFTSLIDAGILKRIISLSGAARVPACWCFCGSPGRGESLTKVLPRLLVILGDENERPVSLEVYQRVLDSLADCGYLAPADSRFEQTFYAASLAEWKERYQGWIRDPVLNETYWARHLFDLRPIHGSQALWHGIEATVTDAVNRDFLYLLANDCLENLPPLTFFQDAVVNESGEETAVFRLEQNAVLPLVDVGRVFGMAAKKVLGGSTLERFAMARSLMPEHESIFREASETLRIVLWQQSRIGISQGTSGAELPPSLLSRYDRQILKSGFRSILQLLEFTSDLKWLETV